MNPKYQIFISSTYLDLKEEREQVLKSILTLGHIPIGMEMFYAANETQWEMIKRRIEESDYYIVIITHRYGSIEEESGLSYTEKEYDYANSIGVPTLGFVLDRSAAWPGDQREDAPQKQAGLKAFIGKVEKKMRASWTNKDDLSTAVTLALNQVTTAFPRVGWVRADQTVNPDLVNEFTRLSKENAELREENTRLKQSQHPGAPMPELSVDLKIIRAQHKWYAWRPDREPSWNQITQHLPAHMRSLGAVPNLPFDRKSPVVEDDREGSWLQMTIRNSGTLATNLSTRIHSNRAIIDQEDIETFNKRNSGLDAAVRVASSFEQGWHIAEYNDQVEEGKPVWYFSGEIRALKPGQRDILLLPLSNNYAFMEDAVITVRIFPTTGRHIEQTYELKELLPSITWVYDQTRPQPHHLQLGFGPYL